MTEPITLTDPDGAVTRVAPWSSWTREQVRAPGGEPALVTRLEQGQLWFSAGRSRSPWRHEVHVGPAIVSTPRGRFQVTAEPDGGATIACLAGRTRVVTGLRDPVLLGPDQSAAVAGDGRTLVVMDRAADEAVGPDLRDAPDGPDDEPVVIALGDGSEPEPEAAPDIDLTDEHEPRGDDALPGGPGGPAPAASRGPGEIGAAIGATAGRRRRSGGRGRGGSGGSGGSGGGGRGGSGRGSGGSGGRRPGRARWMAWLPEVVAVAALLAVLVAAVIVFGSSGSDGGDQAAPTTTSSGGSVTTQPSTIPPSTASTEVPTTTTASTAPVTTAHTGPVNTPHTGSGRLDDCRRATGGVLATVTVRHRSGGAGRFLVQVGLVDPSGATFARGRARSGVVRPGASAVVRVLVKTPDAARGACELVAVTPA